MHVFKFMQKRFTGVCENMSEAGKLVSCQVLQQKLSCYRTLSYLLCEVNRWFHLTCFVFSSAPLGVSCQGGNANSLDHKCLRLLRLTER